MVAPEKRNVVKEIANERGIDYIHHENDFVDFQVQPLLPHMHSQNGPGIAVADINRDGLEDFYVGGASGFPGYVYTQTADGKFNKQPIDKAAAYEDMGVVFFDANNDGFPDLYVVSGGSENKEGSETQQDRLYINDGKGRFALNAAALPDTKASGSCVVANDFDNDGDVDLFVGGRVTPGNYPMPCRSYLLRNDSKESNVQFTDVTLSVAPQLIRPGMVTSALWSDFDNDNKIDLIITGEFMPVKFFRNTNGTFAEVSTGIRNVTGWWNSIAAADFDEDGDIDYVAGNLGLNSRLKASHEQPLCVYAKDYDKNGLVDPVLCYYVDKKNQVYATRDEMIRQINPMRARFNNYESYAEATFNESFTKEEIKDAYVVKAETFETSYIENAGNGKFTMRLLPLQVQFAPVFGLITGDYNGDGFIDILAAGNSYATEASTGRYDALKGTLLAGDGKGNFVADVKSSAGFKADQDVKGLATLFLNDSTAMVLVANNNSRMEAYMFPSAANKVYDPKKDDVYALIKKRNGKTVKHEFYTGNNYLSQSSQKLIIGNDVEALTIFDKKGKSTKIVY